MAEEPERQHKTGATSPGQDYLRPILRRWKLCFLVPVGLGAATYGVAFLLPKRYEAESTVRFANVQYPGNTMNLSGVTPQDLKTSFKAGEVLEKVDSALKLSADYGIDTASLAGPLLAVVTPRGTNRIDIRARMPSPELAQKVSTMVAREGISHYEEAMKREYGAMLKKLEEEARQANSLLDQAEADLEKSEVANRLDTLRELVKIHRTLGADREKRILQLRIDLAVERAKIAAYEKQLQDRKLASEVETVLANSPPLKQGLVDLEKARADLEAFRKKSKTETLKAEVAVQQGLKSQRENERAALGAEQAGVRAKVEALRKGLAEENPTVRLDRKLVGDAAFQQALAKLSGKALQELLALNMTESEVNLVYVALKTELATAVARDKEISGQLAALGQAAEDGDRKLAALQERLFGQEREMESLKLRQELAMKRVLSAAEAVAQDRGVLTPVYLQALQKLIAAKSQEAGNRAELGVLEKAAGESKKALSVLEDQFFDAERTHRSKVFRRDRAESAASGTMANLRAVRNIPRWPPVSLTVTPASLAGTPVSPQKIRIAGAVLVASGLLIWGAVLYLARRQPR